MPGWVIAVGVVLGVLFSIYSCYRLTRWMGKWRPHTAFREPHYPQFVLGNSQTISVDQDGMIHGWSRFPFTLVNATTQERHEAEQQTAIDYDGKYGPKRRAFSFYVVEYTPIDAGKSFTVASHDAADVKVTLYTIGDTWVQGRYSNLPDTMDEAAERFWTIGAGSCLVWVMVVSCGAFGILLLLPY